MIFFLNMRLSYFYILLHLLAWTGLYLLISPLPLGIIPFQLDPFNDSQLSLLLLYGFVINALMIYAYAHVVLPNYVKRQNLSYFLVANVTFLTGFTVLESFLDYYFFLWAYSRLGTPDEADPIVQHLFSNFVLNAFVLLAANVYGFAFAWFRDQRLRRSLEQEKLRAELTALKHQINPHFLFNILNGLYALAFKNNDEQTAEGIAKLSHIMRYMIYESNDDRVPLDKEIEYIESYIDLQKLRTSGETQIRFDVQGLTRDKLVAPMIFTPFIENAFKYGISTAKPSDIDISMRVEGDQLRFQVANVNHALNRTANSAHGGIGLINVKRRLNLLYQGAYALYIDNQDNMYRIDLRLDLAHEPVRKITTEIDPKALRRMKMDKFDG